MQERTGPVSHAALVALLEAYDFVRDQGLDVPVELAHAIGRVRGEAIARREGSDHGEG